MQVQEILLFATKSVVQLVMGLSDASYRISESELRPALVTGISVSMLTDSTLVTSTSYLDGFCCVTSLS